MYVIMQFTDFCLNFFVLGTSMYRAPELLHRYAPTKAADMWSMGVTALEVFTGE